MNVTPFSDLLTFGELWAETWTRVVGWLLKKEPQPESLIREGAMVADAGFGASRCQPAGMTEFPCALRIGREDLAR